jgi:DNA mismatch endonuclease (patch repair protein)
MVDRIAPSQRSALMSRIRGKNTKPELILRKLLFKMGLRYRIHQNNLPSKPDIVFNNAKIAIFVHGCFWHQHNKCKFAYLPATRKDYWLPKLKKNVKRDKEAISNLRKNKWKVHVVWECDLKNNKKSTDIAKRIASQVWRMSARHYKQD